MKLDQTNIEAIETLADSLGVDIESHSDEAAIYSLYDDMLDECCTCSECGKGGADLKADDPIAYHCGFSDWTNIEVQNDTLFYIGFGYYTEEMMREIQEALKDAIDELF